MHQTLNIGLLDRPILKVRNDTTLTGYGASITYSNFYFLKRNYHRFISFKDSSDLIVGLATGEVDFLVHTVSLNAPVSHLLDKNITFTTVVSENVCTLVTESSKPREKAIGVISSLNLLQIHAILCLVFFMGLIMLISALYERFLRRGSVMAAAQHIQSSLFSVITGITGGSRFTGFSGEQFHMILLSVIIMAVYLIILWFGSMFTVNMITYEEEPTLDVMEQLESWDFDVLLLPPNGCTTYLEAQEKGPLSMLSGRGLAVKKMDKSFLDSLLEHRPGRCLAFMMENQASLNKKIYQDSDLTRASKYVLHIGKLYSAGVSVLVQSKFTTSEKAWFIQTFAYNLLERGVTKKVLNQRYISESQLGWRVEGSESKYCSGLPISYQFISTGIHLVLFRGLTFSIIVFVLEKAVPTKLVEKTVWLCRNVLQQYLSIH